MALSASELLQLQQSLTQLAKASSNIASFATQLGSVQGQNVTATQTETRLRRTVIDDYDSLSKTLKNQSKEFKDVLKNVNDFSASVTDIKNKHDAVADKLNTLQAAIAAAGTATTQQITRQNRLTTLLDRYSERLNNEASAERSTNISNAVIGLIESTSQAARNQSEYERDFYGRQLATEIRSSLANITNQIGGTFGDQLLRMTDVSQIAGFAEAQNTAIQSIISNNRQLDDSNADLINEYVRLGRSLGYTSTEFDFLAAHLGARAPGSSIDISQSSLDTLNNAQETIANVINDSNERISQTIDRDLRSFGSNLRGYMHENRNGFERLIYELHDINTRRGSLTSGQGRDEATDALHSAVGMLGRDVIPKLTAMLKTIGNYYTNEYDALTNFVQTNRLTALQLNMTEDQYRQSRAESKATWNLAAQSGQEQLDEFLTSRRRSLEAVYGTEPMLRDKMGTSFYKLTQLFGTTGSEITSMVKDFENLGMTSRMSSVEITDLFLNLVDSNDNMKLMNGLSERGRQLRVQELRNTTALVSSLGLAGESAVSFAKALTESPTKAAATSDIMGQFGSTQVLYNQMSNIAQMMGIQLGVSSEQMKELGYLRGLQKMGVGLTDDQTQTITRYSDAIANFESDMRGAMSNIAKEKGSSAEAFYAELQPNQLLYNLQEFTKTSGMDPLIDPLLESKIAMEKYNDTQGKLITSNDELRRALDRQAELARQRADEIKTAKTITGAAAEANRFVEGAQGNMWTDLAINAGGGVIAGGVLRAAPAIAGILGPMMAPMMGTLAGLALPALGVLAAGGALYAGYKALTPSKEETAETQESADVNKQPKEAPKRVEPVREAPMVTTTPLPSGKLEAAETSAATSALNEQFTKYFNSVDVQNTMMIGFLRQLANNSDGVGKDIKDWYKLYQDIHPIVPITEETTKKKSGDASATPG